MSDYVKPNVGDIVIVSSVEEGDEAVLRVVDVCFSAKHQSDIARTSGGAMWFLDTGKPVNMSECGHTIRVEREGYLLNKSIEMIERLTESLNDSDATTLARVYDLLLREMRS